MDALLLILIVDHVIRVVGDVFQAAVIQPQDLRHGSAFKAPISAVNRVRMLMRVVPAGVLMAVVPMLFEVASQSFHLVMFVTLDDSHQFGVRLHKQKRSLWSPLNQKHDQTIAEFVLPDEFRQALNCSSSRSSMTAMESACSICS